jgi:hypothetical protein
MVHQLWKNSDQEFAEGQVEDVINAVAKWGRDNGAVDLRCVAYTPVVAKVFEKYGWEYMPRVLMRQDIDRGGIEE